MISPRAAAAHYLLRNRILPLHVEDAEPANNAPVIDLAGTDVRSDKSVSSLVGTTSVSPLATAQVLDVDGSDLNSITMQISGILDAEETLTIGDAVIDLSADASDTTEILGVTFAIEYVQSTGVLTITESVAVPEVDAFRIRETGASAEDDYTLTELDDGTVDTFVGANDGAVPAWYDKSGNENHVTQSTTTLQPKVAVAGTVQEGVVFDGSNDRLQIADQIVSGTAMSMMGWVKRTGGIGSEYLCVSGYDKAGLMIRRPASTNHVAAYVVTSTGTKLCDSGESVVDGEWTHLAMTWDGTNIKVYINGVLKNTVAAGGTITYQGWLSICAVMSSASVAIESNHFGGAISDVRAYGTALSESEINSAMAGGSVGTPLLWLPGNYTP